jgi:hypothetical protein
MRLAAEARSIDPIAADGQLRKPPGVILAEILGHASGLRLPDRNRIAISAPRRKTIVRRAAPGGSDRFHH